jgi:hypothetical protein
LHSIRRQDAALRVTLANAYSDQLVERIVDQVVVEHGTIPVDELYHDLAPQSQNHGQTDLRALIAGQPQTIVANQHGTYQLFRIGDAVAHRNIHAAILDARRLCAQL